MKLTLRPVKGRNAHCRGPLCPTFAPIIPPGTMALEVQIRPDGKQGSTLLYCPTCTNQLAKLMGDFARQYADFQNTPPADLSKFELILGAE